MLSLASLALVCGAVAGADLRTLELGQPLAVEFGALDAEPVFRVVVPEHATALSVATRGANFDVALYGSFGAVPDLETGAWDVTSEGTWIDETLLVTATDAVPLDAGDWYFVVALSGDEIGVTASDRVAFTVDARLLEPSVHELLPDVPLEVVLDAHNGLRAELRLRLDDEQRRKGWRVEVFSPVFDVDLLAGPTARERTHHAPFAVSETALSWEHVDLRPRWLARGTHVQVYAYPGGGPVPEMRVRAVLTRADTAPVLVPEAVLPPAAGVPGVASPFARAVAATVAVFGPLGGGSGVVVTDDGLILTNAHVVVGARRGRRRHELACAFTTDPTLPAVPAFALEVLDSREDLDLALVRVVGTLDGRPLPRSVRFPTIELAPPEPVPLGATVFGIGYPMTGGSGSYVSVSLTRGIVAGFATEAEGLVLKTDAAIHSGVSGGACIDEAGRLIGIPTYSIADANDSGGLGFVLPLALLPDSFRERIAASRGAPGGTR